jgi:uncharacterized protein YyaL (SSP411 family)
VKVDREERPDVDRVYMTFVQATTGAGGWPMSVWLTPELQPFFGGTYFPPSSRWGRPGFIDVLTRDRPRVEGRAREGASVGGDHSRRLKAATTAADRPERAPVGGSDGATQGVARSRSVRSAARRLWRRAEVSAPVELMFLLTRTHARRTDAQDDGARDAAGDGDGRHARPRGRRLPSLLGRRRWRVPHFEKMLYDQAQLVLAYLEASQASGDPFYAAVAEDTLDYVVRDLTSPDGGFYSARTRTQPFRRGPRRRGERARTLGRKREGAFYVFSAAKSTPDGRRRRRGAPRFGVEPSGNALADPQGEFTD